MKRKVAAFVVREGAGGVREILLHSFVISPAGSFPHLNYHLYPDFTLFWTCL